MTLIWGKSCRVCGNTANEGDYCERCYGRQFPVCEYCRKPIRDGEEEVDNCHKKPCYSNKTGRCCECGAITNRGSYCKSCYDPEYRPPLRAEVLVGGVNLKLSSRTEVNQKMIESTKLILLPPSEKDKIQETSAWNKRRWCSLAFYFAVVISFVLYGFLYLLYVLFQFLRPVL